MAQKRTPEEIKRQIEGLKIEKGKLPQRSAFGDDNWATIDAQISILNEEKDAEDYCFDEDQVYSSALDAEEWLLGERKEDLFK